VTTPALRLTADVAVIGAGILGLATARELVRREPALRVVVLEKESLPARHQTGHNSGVIHSGLYYAAGSAKARLCVQGRALLLDYLREHQIPFDVCGKIVVAAEEAELAPLEGLRARGAANGVAGIEVLDDRQIREVEPAVRGLRALWVPSAGIVDFAAVAGRLADEIRAAGVRLELGVRVTAVEHTPFGIRLRVPGGTVDARAAIACAGLHSDHIADLAGRPAPPRIVPFRGDYYVLRPERRSLIRGLVYPVPDPRFPFLGVHFTRRIDGAVWLGPNAVLAFAREGYRRTDVNLRDLAASIGYRGFQRLAATHWRTGLAELARDYWRPAFLGALRRYVPELRGADLRPGPSGVRAQALDEDGRLVDDFAYDVSGTLLNVRNAPSPAATSSFALARQFVDRLAELR